MIDIIAILAAMLLPALSQARESARIGICQNNLKQMALGWAMYGTNQNEYCPLTSDYVWGLPLPAHPNGYNYFNNWDYAITLYIDKSEDKLPFPWRSPIPGYLQCPSDGCPREYNIAKRSYAMNAVFGLSCYYHCHRILKQPKITRPAGMLVLIEHWTEHNRYCNGQQHWAISVAAYPTYHNRQEDNDFDMHRKVRYVTHAPNNTISADGGKGANCSFADGHVAMMTQEQMEGLSAGIWNYNGTMSTHCGGLDTACVCGSCGP